MILFFPPCRFEPAILKERIGDHRHERMTTQALPGPTLKVVETKLLLQLLVSLLLARHLAFPPRSPEAFAKIRGRHL